MGTNSSDNLIWLYSELQVLRRQEEKICKETETILAKAKASIDPRQNFNNWRRANAGKDWKRKQFKHQDSRCAYCGDFLRFADAIVHHVLPLKDFGSDANKPKNFRLLHSGCNLAIGTDVVDFS